MIDFEQNKHKFLLEQKHMMGGGFCCFFLWGGAQQGRTIKIKNVWAMTGDKARGEHGEFSQNVKFLLLSYSSKSFNR